MAASDLVRSLLLLLCVVFGVLVGLAIFLISVTMVCGPIATFLGELFATKICCTSMSLPYHIGSGWFRGMLPLPATAVVA